MKKRIFSIFLIFVFLFSNTAFVYAKSSSRSFSSSKSSSFSSSKSSGYSGSSSSKSSSSSSRSVTGSSSKSSGYSGSSAPKSSTSDSSGSTSSGSSSKSSGYSGSTSGSSSAGSASGSSSSSSKSSGYSGSTSGSSSAGSSKSTTTGSTSTKAASKTESLKNSYMEDAYKKQTSSSNYSSYKSKLNDEQKKTYEDSMKKNYTTTNKMDFEQAMNTRTSRMNDYNTRPIRININTGYFGGPLSYGMGFAGPWDLWFLMRASDLFWYHHWSDISPYRNYFEAAQFAEMESRISKLEAQNVARDPNYMEPGVDPDLMFSSDYEQNNLDKIYYTNKYTKPVQNPFTVFIPVLLISVGLIIIIYTLSRRKPQKPGRNSGGIY